MRWYTLKSEELHVYIILYKLLCLICIHNSLLRYKQKREKYARICIHQRCTLERKNIPAMGKGGTGTDWLQWLWLLTSISGNDAGEGLSAMKPRSKATCARSMPRTKRRRDCKEKGAIIHTQANTWWDIKKHQMNVTFCGQSIGCFVSCCFVVNCFVAVAMFYNLNMAWLMNSQKRHGNHQKSTKFESEWARRVGLSRKPRYNSN